MGREQTVRDQIDATIDQVTAPKRVQGTFVLGKEHGTVRPVYFDVPLDLTTEDILELSSLIGSHLPKFLELQRRQGLVVAHAPLVKPS